MSIVGGLVRAVEELKGLGEGCLVMLLGATFLQIIAKRLCISA